MTGRVLILGARGQVGGALAALPWEGGVRACDSGMLDVTDRAAVRAAIAAERPALVLNGAAYTAVDRAESEAARAHAVNADAAGHIAEACAESGAALVHLSTDYVFDGRKPTPYGPQDPIAPLGVYGAAKAAGEALVRQRLERHVIIRLSWIFSEGGSNFVRTMLRLGHERPALRVVNDQVGGPTYAGHVAQAIAAVAASLRRGAQPWGTYHYADAPDVSWHAFAEAIFAAARPFGWPQPPIAAIPSSEYPTPVRRPANSRFDCASFTAAFGFARQPWQAGLDRVVAALARGGL